MCKKLLVICLALVMSSACYAESIIGNWEGTNDGWTSAASPGYSSSTGVTLGDQAWLLYPPAGWSTLMSAGTLAVGEGMTMAELKAPGAYFEIDITWVADEWVSDGPEGDIWVKLDAMAIQGDGLGWTQFNVSVDTANPSYPGSWDPYYWGGGAHTRTLRYDLPDVSAFSDTPTWFQIFLHANYGTNGGTILQSGGYYVDNFRLVPEPATIAMLGIGALALIRKRK